MIVWYPVIRLTAFFVRLISRHSKLGHANATQANTVESASLHQKTWAFIINRVCLREFHSTLDRANKIINVKLHKYHRTICLFMNRTFWAKSNYFKYIHLVCENKTTFEVFVESKSSWWFQRISTQKIKFSNFYHF